MEHLLTVPSANVDQLIIVAAVGLAINVAGLFLFGGHGHGHSHGGDGGHGHSHGGKKENEKESHGHGHAHGGAEESHGHGHAHGGAEESHSHGHAHGGAEENHGHGEHKGPKPAKAKRNANIEGVFLHVLGDALGSVGVIISGLVIKYCTGPARFVADPCCSLAIVLIIVRGTVPLLRRITGILLQQVPEAVDLPAARKALETVEGVVDIHDLHVWQLSDATVVGSMHAILRRGTDFQRASDEMKLLMHFHGVHATTVQPEFAGDAGLRCDEPVCAAADCAEKACCPLPDAPPAATEENV